MRNVENLTVTVKVSELLEALKKNRALHITEYAEARSRFCEKVGQKLAKFGEQAHAGEIPAHNFQHGLQVPVDRLVDYDKYIGMLSMAQDETLEITTHQYDCFVNDTWDWAVSAKLINSSYIG